jgi:hypothetical protein
MSFSSDATLFLSISMGTSIAGLAHMIPPRGNSTYSQSGTSVHSSTISSNSSTSSAKKKPTKSRVSHNRTRYAGHWRASLKAQHLPRQHTGKQPRLAP